MSKGRNGTEARPFAANVHFGQVCHEWMGNLSAGGYGFARHPVTNKIVQSHRLAYEIFNGPIPDGMVVCHSCDNPRCVRREHLSVGTAFDNQRDSVSKRRHWQSRKTHCAKGHEFTTENTYSVKMPSGTLGRQCRECHRIREAARRVAG